MSKNELLPEYIFATETIPTMSINHGMYDFSDSVSSRSQFGLERDFSPQSRSNQYDVCIARPLAMHAALLCLRNEEVECKSPTAPRL
ncbi:hypothetical protein HOV93_24640 [Planctomycetes bacterium FF15]|uniref:Uncharacterized protein n=1 Tax=Bremerella alba TaxID=980252 RepID=A0A7V8V5N4_9BACT|nr:hypothetical protein [Bremerella alba]